MGGEISVTSQVGTGSTFHIELASGDSMPAAADDAPDVQLQRQRQRQ